MHSVLTTSQRTSKVALMKKDMKDYMFGIAMGMIIFLPMLIGKF